VCAASETVWLAMECKNVEYLTVLVSKDATDDAVPRIVWPKGDGDDDDNNDAVETDPVKLLEQIQSRYPDRPPQFYPRISSAVDASRCNILRLPGVMPRFSHPDLDSLAPFLFREDGTLVKRASHCVSLEEVEEMQEEYFLGSFLCGRDVTAADMVWAPYLERYAVQLPLLFPNSRSCDPRSKAYEEVSAWYASMERLPEYACRVQGDARHWRRCLELAVSAHNNRAVGDEEKVTGLPPVPDKFGWWMRKNPQGEALWKEYAESRPWLADTPGGEVASYLMRNREEVAASAALGTGMAPDVADEALREVVQLLVAGGGVDDEGDEGLSENGCRLARYVSETLQVPRDVGMIPALALGELVQSSLLTESKV